MSQHTSGFKSRIQTALKKEFFVVPKPSTSKDPAEWRLDFHDAEKEIIGNKGCAKMVIKLLKLFKAKNNFNPSSYLLKSIIMDMIRQEPTWDWEQKEVATYFIKVNCRSNDTIVSEK